MYLFVLPRPPRANPEADGCTQRRFRGL